MAVDTVPREVVEAKMKEFEDAYNADDTAKSASLYADPCLVTVNGGAEEGGPFTGKSPSECAAFLDGLRNAMGGTNIKFTVVDVTGNVHKDTWVADNGTGTCEATWEKQADGSWAMTADKITFTPKAAAEE